MIETTINDYHIHIYYDENTRALWMGESLDLNLEIFQRL